MLLPHYRRPGLDAHHPEEDGLGFFPTRPLAGEWGDDTGAARSHRPWHRRAACRDLDPKMFFQPVGRSVPRQVRAICARCPVGAECLAEQLEFEHGHGTRHGVWGGTTPIDRRELARSA